ncbi:hypothetical protein PACILC2_19690 [Paenibacillus cisolokensis]|jgi:hypothetical protein|uniref:Uncharacterized protein n=1 Tax=Paenibacillus cisolokensis TaxID=1658519 RepID=A0ABQ4N5G6_9BACL|nr:hypothetical protein [Paenibacillus cisolokensis]GIQ63401.1 hypothetical protein PACILC2_19690 [Paenibacillus cisolokensis]
MRIKKSVITFAAVIMLTSSTSAIVQASNDSKRVESEVVTPFYEYVSLVGASISIGTLGKAVASGFVFYTGNYNSTLTIELQRLNGSSWTTVKSWSESFTGKGQHSIEEEYYVTSGHTYRVLTIVAIKSGSTVLETASSTSAQVSY